MYVKNHIPNKMNFYIFALMFFCIAEVDAKSAPRTIRQVTTTTTPPDLGEDAQMSTNSGDSCNLDEDTNRRASMALELLPEPMTREHTAVVLQRALDMLKKTPSPSKTRRGPNFDQEAKNLLRFLTEEPGIGSTSNSSQMSQSERASVDENYQQEPIFIAGTNRRISVDTMRRVIDMHEQNRSEQGIRGKYRWYNRQYLDRFKQYLEAGGNRGHKHAAIDKAVAEKVKDARDRRLPVHDYMIKKWGLEVADRLGAFEFKAGHTWIQNIKKRHGIASRKVTKYSSRAENEQQEETQRSQERFLEEYGRIRHLFPRRLVWNFDQSSFKYEVSNERTLSFVGERDTVLNLDSRNKNTHSYTVQATISRSGHLIGRLLLCMQEDQDSFGPRVQRQVDELVEQYGNIMVYASRSGKMTRSLINRWLEEELIPNMNRAMRANDGETVIGSQNSSTSRQCLINDGAGPSWANSTEELDDEQRSILKIRNSSNTYVARPDLLLLADSWGGHSSDSIIQELAERRIQMFQIPKHTTGYLQPCDVGLFRQHKRFRKLISEEASSNNLTREIMTRAGIINFQSLIWNQLQAPAYRDLLLWSWRHTDPEFSNDELQNGAPPAVVNDINFNFERHQTCGHPGCNATAFIRCSHCGKYLCIRHFLDRECFHRIEEDDDEDEEPFCPADIPSDVTTKRPPRPDDDTHGGAAGAIVTGLAVGPALAGVAGSVGASVAGASTSIAAVSGASARTSGSSNDPVEEIPLLDIQEIKRPEWVSVQMPKSDLSGLIRDRK